jgi:hypothetical protein
MIKSVCSPLFCMIGVNKPEVILVFDWIAELIGHSSPAITRRCFVGG